MRRWTHFHFLLGGGFLFALATTHLLWVLTVTFASGIAVGLSWRVLRRGASQAGSIVAAKIATERERQREIYARRRAQVDKSRASREKLDKAYERGYVEAKLDGAK